MSAGLPVADVLWWNERDVQVRYPFCDKSHRHEMVDGGKRYHRSTTRVASCSPVFSLASQQYQIRFPFDIATQGVAYEINKKKHRFQTIGIQQDSEDEEMLVEVLESELKLVDTSKYSQFLVRGKDDTGNTALSLAAAEINPKMVSLLLERGSDVNNQGRTPLMEAALWGRAENVEILLQNDADKGIQDRSGYIASDFAAPHARNFEERLSRAGGRFKENAYEADQQRRIIARMLDSQPPRSSISLAPANPRDDALNFLLFHKSLTLSCNAG